MIKNVSELTERVLLDSVELTSCLKVAFDNVQGKLPLSAMRNCRVESESDLEQINRFMEGDGVHLEWSYLVSTRSKQG